MCVDKCMDYYQLPVGWDLSPAETDAPYEANDDDERPAKVLKLFH